jgi:hypothetical protein
MWNIVDRDVDFPPCRVIALAIVTDALTGLRLWGKPLSYCCFQVCLAAQSLFVRECFASGTIYPFESQDFGQKIRL